MDNEYKKCAKSHITRVPVDMYHQVTLEILRRFPYSGTKSKISQEYWDDYIKVYNGLIDKCELDLNK
ncbi:hypothetical protein [Cellulosilyticum sp. WCF-2]|uniref:hypothetical protein n=1 Tax=Cellulosilyticum sp. WCF-2 TaxID=2497860 RepID=UPI000F8F436B|nr:hypothetical protein [Cellulosilyticum sp. WCF-2]QEH69739.1 hypothetical protein EKH84_15590 [Cellulosilyticum sp. WCF-2]